MIQGTRSRLFETIPGVNPRIDVRIERFRAAFAAIGITSKEGIARACGLDPKSVWRLFQGEQIGEQVMARTIATLQREQYRRVLAEVGIEPTLDSLFEVSVDVAEAVA